jgi:diketogulonate reductase-like aldo/keto reductase
LHWPGSHPLEDTLAAFEELRQAGKVRSYGVSNFDAGQFEEAARLAGPGRIACNQVLYHLEERWVETRLYPHCRRLGAALVGYSPFGSGSFPAASSKGGRALAAIAQARGTTARQVALAFLVRLEGTFAIPKAGDAQHAVENAAAGDLRLSAGEIAQLDAAFPVRDAGELPSL